MPPDCEPGRLADIHIFAWHGESEGNAGHRDTALRRFFVLAERALPAGQSTIRLEWIADYCGIAGPGEAVRDACPSGTERKAAGQGPDDIRLHRRPWSQTGRSRDSEMVSSWKEMQVRV